MNNKGFTLMEMLATVVIVGILLSITTISIVGYIDDSRDKGEKVEEANIITAAQTCLKEKKCAYEWEDALENGYEKACISINDLKTYGYLDRDKTFTDSSDAEITHIYFKRNKETKVITEKRIADNDDCS